MLDKLLSPLKTFGFCAGTLYLVDRGLRKASDDLGLNVYELMVQPISAKPLLPPNLAKNLTFAEIERGDPAVDDMPARPEIKEQRFARGAHCLGAYRKGTLVGYSWFCYERYEEDEVRCDYELGEPEHSVFDFDLYVMPEHRMGIGFMAVWHGVNQYLSARGIRYTFSRLTRFNVASRRAHQHFGWRCVGRAVFFRAWRVELMAATLWPYLAVTWSPSQRVRLRLFPRGLAAAATADPRKANSIPTTLPTGRTEL